VKLRNPGPEGQVNEKGYAIKIQLFDFSSPMIVAPTFAMTTYRRSRFNADSPVLKHGSIDLAMAQDDVYWHYRA